MVPFAIFVRIVPLELHPGKFGYSKLISIDHSVCVQVKTVESILVAVSTNHPRGHEQYMGTPVNQTCELSVNVWELAVNS